MMKMMTRRTLYTALLALFVVGAVGVPLQAQTQEEGEPAAKDEQTPDRSGERVTVRVTNDNWSNMRIYVVETASQRLRWRLGTVTSLSKASFELPDYLGGEHGDLVLVAVALGSRQQVFTPHLLTWPGALVDWTISTQPSLSFATVF